MRALTFHPPEPLEWSWRWWTGVHAEVGPRLGSFEQCWCSFRRPHQCAWFRRCPESFCRHSPRSPRKCRNSPNKDPIMGHNNSCNVDHFWLGIADYVKKFIIYSVPQLPQWPQSSHPPEQWAPWWGPGRRGHPMQIWLPRTACTHLSNTLIN